MTDAVKRYSERQIADAYMKFRMAIKGNSISEAMDFIAATDYDALVAENVRVRESVSDAINTMRRISMDASMIGYMDSECWQLFDDLEKRLSAALAASNDKGDGK